MKTLENIQRAIEEVINPDFDFLNSLKNNKVLITISNEGKISCKVIEISPKKERTILPKEVRSKIILIKKAVKVNADITWLFALIDDVKKCVKSLDFKVISQEATDKIKLELDRLDDIIGKTTLKIESLPKQGEKK